MAVTRRPFKVVGEKSQPEELSMLTRGGLRRMLYCGPVFFLFGTQAASAGSFEFGDGFEGSYKFTLGYAAALRMERPEESLINGPVDPLQPQLLPPVQPGQNQLIGFAHTGLPIT